MILDTVLLIMILGYVIKKSRPEKFRGGELKDHHFWLLLH
jgi:hypothetical protein